MSGSSISWAICKSAPRSRQITTPTNSVKALKALKWQMQMKSNCLINSEVVRKWWASCTWALTSVAGTCLAWRHHGTRRSATCRWPERTAWRPASSAPSSSDNSHDALYNKHSHIYVLLRAIADKPAPAANYLESAVNHRPDLPTVMLIIIGIPSPTHSLSHSRLKSFLFCRSSLPQPFLFLLQD